MSEKPRGRDGQEGGFPACVCAGTAPAELRSPVLGLRGDVFRHRCVDSVAVYVRRKAFVVFCTCYLWDGEQLSVVVFTPCLERPHKGMGQLILRRLLSSDLFRSNT